MNNKTITKKNFYDLIPDEDIINTARKYGYEDERDRYLSLKIIFWGIVLISTDIKRSIYPQIIRILPKLFKKYGKGEVTVSAPALCQKYAALDWKILRDIYNTTLEK